MNISQINTRRVAAGIVLLLLLTLLVGTVAKKIVPPPPESPPEGPTEQCIHAPYFFANDARPGSNQFGPELVDRSLKAGVDRWEYKLVRDPSFAAVWEDVILYDLGKVKAHGDTWYTMRAQQFLDNEDLWCKQVGAIKDAIRKMEIQDRTEEYHTFLMVPQGENIPLVRRTDRPVAMGHVLVFQLKDGRTEYARYICDLQPARPEIPGLPPISKPSKPADKPPAKPKGCPPSQPHGTWPICKDDPSRDPSKQGNVPDQVTGTAPPVVDPASPPKAGNPPEVYVPPTTPVPTTVPRTTIPPNEGQPPDKPVPPDDPTGPVCDPRVCEA